MCFGFSDVSLRLVLGCECLTVRLVLLRCNYAIVDTDLAKLRVIPPVLVCSYDVCLFVVCRVFIVLMCLCSVCRSVS